MHVKKIQIAFLLSIYFELCDITDAGIPYCEILNLFTESLQSSREMDTKPAENVINY